eukprot:s3924_g10.t1
MSDQEGSFVVIFAPTPQLMQLQEGHADLVPWANPLTGESSEVAGIEESRLDFGKGVGHFLVLKDELRAQLLDKGEDRHTSADLGIQSSTWCKTSHRRVYHSAEYLGDVKFSTSSALRTSVRSKLENVTTSNNPKKRGVCCFSGIHVDPSPQCVGFGSKCESQMRHGSNLSECLLAVWKQLTSNPAILAHVVTFETVVTAFHLEDMVTGDSLATGTAYGRYRSVLFSLLQLLVSMNFNRFGCAPL